MAQTNPRKPRLQFTLRRLFLTIAVAGLLLAVTARQIIEYRQSRMVAVAVADLGGSVRWQGSRIRDVRFQNPQLSVDQWHTLSNIPYRFTLDVDGKSFTAKTMHDIVEIENLEYLVLHNTSLMQNDVVKFQKQRPDVGVMIDIPGIVSHSHKEFPRHTR